MRCRSSSRWLLFLPSHEEKVRLHAQLFPQLQEVVRIQDPLQQRVAHKWQQQQEADNPEKHVQDDEQRQLYATTVSAAQRVKSTFDI